MQPKLYSAYSQGAAAKVCHQVCICSTARLQGELTVHVRGWNLALNSFGLFQLRVSPGLIDVAKERASHVSIPEQSRLGSPRMDVSAVCGRETDFTSVLALASSAAGKSPNVTRELYKCSKCQDFFSSPPVCMRMH